MQINHFCDTTEARLRGEPLDSYQCRGRLTDVDFAYFVALAHDVEAGG